MSLVNIIFTFLIFSISGFISTQAAPLSEIQIQQEHNRGVELARSGKHKEGLEILHSLLTQAPDNYPLLRDIIIITTWDDDCPSALQLYKPIQDRSGQEPYLIAPVSECLYNSGNQSDAISKLKAGIEQWPEDSGLKEQLDTLNEKKRAAQESRELELLSTVAVSFGTNESDQGNREWSFATRYTKNLNKNARIYARLISSRADDPQFNTGDLNRAAVGTHLGFTEKWSLNQDFSFDVRRNGENGSTTTLTYRPVNLWSFEIMYASYSEELPLRAKALLIDADLTSASVDFHTENYLWIWSVGLSHANFSDNNNRNALNTSLGYAYVLRDDWEQRLILGVYSSENTESNTVYYNPLEDTSITLTHELDVVYASRFKRHIDRLFVSMGSYSQKNEKSEITLGIRFEQEYEFTDYDSLLFNVSLNRNVYDGEKENEKSFFISYSRKIKAL